MSLTSVGLGGAYAPAANLRCNLHGNSLPASTPPSTVPYSEMRIASDMYLFSSG